MILKLEWKCEKEFYIFNDDSIYGLNYTEEDLKTSPENYLASIIQEINEKEGIKENQEKMIHKNNPDIKMAFSLFFFNTSDKNTHNKNPPISTTSIIISSLNRIIDHSLL